MSDLIRYAVGNTVNRDVVQWPTILRSKINDIFGPMTEDERDVIWPVDITKAQIMAIAWRVRKWRLSGGCAAALSYSDSPFEITVEGSGVFVDQDIYALDKDSNAATREQDLVGTVLNDDYQALVGGGTGNTVSGPPVSNWSISGTQDTGGGPIPFSESGSVDGQITIFSPGLVLYDTGTGTFAPAFNGLGTLIRATGFVTPGLLVNVSFCRNPVTVSSGIGPVNLKSPAAMTISPGITPAFTVPMQLSFRLPFENPGSSLVAGVSSGSFSLEAIEFWPFKNSAGLPVYDTGDGHQLRDPFW